MEALEGGGWVAGGRRKHALISGSGDNAAPQYNDASFLLLTAKDKSAALDQRSFLLCSPYIFYHALASVIAKESKFEADKSLRRTAALLRE